MKKKKLSSFSCSFFLAKNARKYTHTNDVHLIVEEYQHTNMDQTGSLEKGCLLQCELSAFFLQPEKSKVYLYTQNVELLRRSFCSKENYV